MHTSTHCLHTLDYVLTRKPILAIVFVDGLRRKIFLRRLDTMSNKPEKIPIANVRICAELLGTITQALEKALADYEAAGIDHVEIDGWPTLYRGLDYVKKQVRKIAGPTSKIVTVRPETMLLDHHKKPNKDSTTLKVAKDKGTQNRRKK